MNKGKKIIIISLAIIFVIIVVGIIFITNGLKEGAKLVVNEVNLGEVEDGTYVGTYTKGRWTNTLSVEIVDHQIRSIELMNDVTADFMTNASEELFTRVISSQSLDVDVVSGATVTSKAYLKAIENALK